MKKLMAVLLTIAMLLTPVLSMAEGLDMIWDATWNGRMVKQETETSMLISLTGDESLDAIVNDVLDVLKVKNYYQLGDAVQGGVTVELSGQDVLTLQGEIAGDTLYVYSDLLGEQTVAVSGDEVDDLLIRLINLFEAMQLITADVANDARSEIAMAFSALDSMELPDFSNVNLEDFDVMPLLIALMGTMSEGEVPTQPRNSDVASSVLTIKLDGQTIASLLDALGQTMLSNESFVAAMDAYLANMGGSVKMLVDELNAGSAELSAQLHADNALALYMNEEGVPVYAVLTLKSADETFGLDLTYAHLTMNEMQTDTVTAILTLAENDSMVFTVNQAVENNSTYVGFSYEYDGIAMNVNWNADSLVNGDTAEDTYSVIVSLSEGGEEVINIIEEIKDAAVKNGQDVTINRKVNVVLNGQHVSESVQTFTTGDPLPTMATDDVVYLARISETDFQNWAVGVVTNAQNWLMKLIQALPESVLTLIMQLAS